MNTVHSGGGSQPQGARGRLSTATFAHACVGGCAPLGTRVASGYFEAMAMRHTLMILGASVAMACDGGGSGDGAGPQTSGGSSTSGSEGDGTSGPSGGSENPSGARTSTGGEGGETTTQGDSGGDTSTGQTESLAIAFPAEGDEVLFSVPVRMAVPQGTTEVTVTAGDASCSATAPGFDCLLDASALPAGPAQIVATASDGPLAGESAEVGVSRRALEPMCAEQSDALDACVVDRAAVGLAAGFEGVSYLNADDLHANVNTGGMVGIDARTYAEPPAEVEADVRMGLMNESTAWILDGGRCSLPRCFPTSRRARALQAYEDNVLFLCPEHRDVGTRDFFQWQAGFYMLSQGSSSSERDETTKGLRALGMMTPQARDAAEADLVLGPTLAMLLVRSRVESDLAYLEPQTHPTAFPDADSGLRILELAAALRADELPPVARVTLEDTMFPEDWGMVGSLQTPYAVGLTPAVTPKTPLGGTFEVRVDLSASEDPNGRPLFFFASTLRDTAGDLEVERVDASGTAWVLRGSMPVDQSVTTGGQDRVVSRVTVALFPHNGLWPGAPVFVSVGGRASEDAAPNDNNLD